MAITSLSNWRQIEQLFFLNSSIMGCTQILVRCWRAQNKDFGTALQTLLTGVRWRLQCRLAHSLCQHLLSNSKPQVSNAAMDLIKDSRTLLAYFSSIDMGCWHNYSSRFNQTKDGVWCALFRRFSDHCYNRHLQQAYGNANNMLMGEVLV